MGGDPPDPLLLGQRVVAILETGLRTATYKLATLMALIDHCIENMPDVPGDVPQVPTPELAHRVLEIYWQQVRLFDAHELRQSTQPRARILIATNALRQAAGVERTSMSVEIARLRAPAAYDHVSRSTLRPVRSHLRTGRDLFEVRLLGHRGGHYLSQFRGCAGVVPKPRI